MFLNEDEFEEPRKDKKTFLVRGNTVGQIVGEDDPCFESGYPFNEENLFFGNVKIVEDDRLTIDLIKLKIGDKVAFTEYDVGSFKGVIRSIGYKRITFERVEFQRGSETYDCVDYSRLYNISTYSVKIKRVAEIRII